MCVNARRVAKLTLLVSDLQDILEEHINDLWIYGLKTIIFVDIGLIRNSY